MVEKDDFPFEEAVRERRRKEKQDELVKRGFLGDLKAFEDNEKIRVQEEREEKKMHIYGTELLWNYLSLIWS